MYIGRADHIVEKRINSPAVSFIEPTVDQSPLRKYRGDVLVPKRHSTPQSQECVVTRLSKFVQDCVNPNANCETVGIFLTRQFMTGPLRVND